MIPDDRSLAGMTRLVLVAAAAVILVGCGSGGGPPPKRDSSGDLYITNAQGRRVRVGMDAKAAFRLLGGRSHSGQHLAGSVPPLSYGYPIWGTGKGDAAGVGEGLNFTYSWLEICVSGGRVVSKHRGTIEVLFNGC